MDTDRADADAVGRAERAEESAGEAVEERTDQSVRDADSAFAESQDDGGAGDAESALAASVQSFLERNFPQISMHGGTAGVEGVDAETGEVWLALGGACSGCGISPMTVQAIRVRLPEAVPGVETVHVDAGPGTHF